MKFANTLEFNSVREWSEHYIHYERLKHIIYEMEQEQASVFRMTRSPTRLTQRSRMSDEEQQSLVVSDQQLVSVKDQEFEQLFMDDLHHVNEFYTLKEKELLLKVTQLYDNVVKQLQSQGSVSTDQLNEVKQHLTSNQLKDMKEATKELYVNLCSLKDYSVLNYSGFTKVLKKHDKVLGTHLLRDSELIKEVDQQYFWRQNAVQDDEESKLYAAIEKTVEIYAYLACNGDTFEASGQLSNYLREFVVFERTTIWKEMLGNEMRVTSAGFISAFDKTKQRLFVRLPGSLGKIKVGNRSVSLVFSLIVLAILMSIDIFEDGPKNRCFAILIFASIMWATEAVPLFVTSMIIPFLIVVSRVLVVSKEDETLMTADAAAKFLFSKMWAPVIMLLLGGFTIAGALSKYGIAKRMATFILSRAGTRSWAVLLAIQFVAWFSSMWISNVAAPVLCFSVIQPILRTLEPGNKFAASIIMGIALSANIGGLATPISSPQNAIALGYMDPSVSWFQWLSLSLPLSILSILVCWLMLLYFYEPGKDTPFVTPIHQVFEPLNRKQYFILAVSASAIVLWCLESQLKVYIGNSGVIAIIPMVAFFGTGILNKDDFNSFLWTVIMLAMGGISLGAAVENTSLLTLVGQGIADLLEGHSLFVALLSFCTLVLVVATFISHTVSALIILPLVQTVGNSLPDNHARLLVLGATMLCSGAMGLPISGFPNINAVSLEDVTGKPYVRTRDFLKVGVPMSVVVLLLTVSLGYGIMLLLGL